MALLIVSFVAGILTVLAPCILPLLPVVIGSSASGRSRSTPYVVVGSLALSVIAFTYLLKASTAFIMVPPEFWTYLSGGIIGLFGLTLIFPDLWSRIPGMARLSAGSNRMVGAGYERKGFLGDVLVGAALGPVFSTCSPTYFVILASVLPASFALGTAYLLAYTLGLALVLLLISLLGARLAGRLSAFADPHSWLKRGIGVVFIILGIAIASGYEKKLETAILNSGFFDVTKVEQGLLRVLESGFGGSGDEASSASSPYVEIVRPSGFVNTDGITIGELVGKKVVLVDFMTYGCINCQRTFPYLNAWYRQYKDQGLEIIGIHTPEFAFERNIDNVRRAMMDFEIMYPVVLDNEYATWNAYGNRYWPRKYLMDIRGNIVYDHIGEGAYEETEIKIRELLAERARIIGEGGDMANGLAVAAIPETGNAAASPETYFGSARNEYFANGARGRSGQDTFVLPDRFALNALYLGGTWDLSREYAESVSTGASVVYRYRAGEVYIVAEASAPVEIEVLQDGVPVGTARGEDVGADGIVTVQDSRLYKLIRNPEAGEHVLELRVRGGGARLYAFTFG